MTTLIHFASPRLRVQYCTSESSGCPTGLRAHYCLQILGNHSLLKNIILTNDQSCTDLNPTWFNYIFLNFCNLIINRLTTASQLFFFIFFLKIVNFLSSDGGLIPKVSPHNYPNDYGLLERLGPPIANYISVSTHHQAHS